MGTPVRLSSKGQIVIPKDVREALGLEAGGTLTLSVRGGQIVMAPAARRITIDYDEFRRRIPSEDGPARTIEAMDAAIDAMLHARSGR